MGPATASPFPLSAAAATSTSAGVWSCLHHRFNVSRTFPPPLHLFPSNCNRNWNCPKTITRSRTSRAVSQKVMETGDNLNDEACELVNGVEISIGEGDGDTINAYLCTAVKNNNGTGILLLSDIFGFEDSATRDFAYRVACNGYNVLVPDLFRGDPWSKDRPANELEPWLLTHNPTRVQNDIAASAKWMSDEFLAAGISKKLGLIGFCYGGGRVIDVLSRNQDELFGIGVSFYGTRIDTSLLPNVSVPVLFVAGDSDPLCSLSVVKEIEGKIRSGSSSSRVVVFEGRGHGFVHRPASADEDRDAEVAFVMLRNWLSEGLQVGVVGES
ncbi:unnamed protein product [Linum tenue]|uniref:Carboxymethylenebutenolidase homolog n=1 Tax=Linum tenue TaxID=586396 RepID=A0AAV0IGW7_9ROSI|nr:unnamed protein product [Linum tenue]